MNISRSLIHYLNVSLDTFRFAFPAVALEVSLGSYGVVGGIYILLMIPIRVQKLLPKTVEWNLFFIKLNVKIRGFWKKNYNTVQTTKTTGVGIQKMIGSILYTYTVYLYCIPILLMNIDTGKQYKLKNYRKGE